MTEWRGRASEGVPQLPTLPILSMDLGAKGVDDESVETIPVGFALLHPPYVVELRSHDEVWPSEDQRGFPPPRE